MANDAITTDNFSEVNEFRTLAGEGEAGMIKIVTSKGGSGVQVRAQVYGHDGFFTTISSSDYSIVLHEEPAKRVTQKKINTLHKEHATPQMLDNVKTWALTHYKEQAAIKAQRGW